MAMTLEKIKGMNLQVGDRIELALKNPLFQDERIRYFQSLDTADRILYVAKDKINGKLVDENEGYYLNRFKDVTKLVRQK